MLATQCSLCGLFGSSGTEDEELWNGCYRLMECKGQCLIFGVSLDPIQQVTFLRLLCRRALEGCALTLTLLKSDQECNQVFVACFRIQKHNFC